MSRRRWALCRSSCSRSRCATRCAPRSRSAISQSATRRLNDFQAIGVSPEIEPFVTVLTGRLAEATGRSHDALAAYRAAAASGQRPAAAAGRLRELSLRYSLGEIKTDETASPSSRS